MTNPNDPAFPQVEPIMKQSDQWQGALEKIGERFIPGLTKREYFAAMALNCLQAEYDTSDMDAKAVAKKTIKLADALIAELNKDVATR